MDLKDIIKMIYPIGAATIPGFAALLPLGIILSMIDAVSIGLRHDIKVDMKLWDIAGLLKVMMEIAQAGLSPTQREQAEAVYFLLVYCTTAEDEFTLHEFLELTLDVQKELPNPPKVPAKIEAVEATPGAGS